MELLSKLGINGKLLLAQIINFIILLWALKKFVYIPLIEVMEKRRKKIEKGLRNAEKAEKRLKEIEAEKERVIKEARKEARFIIEKSEIQAHQQSDKIIKQTQKKAKDIIDEAKKEIEEEKNKSLQEAKSEIAGLASLMAEKIISEKANEKNDMEIINKTIKVNNKEVQDN